MLFSDGEGRVSSEPPRVSLLDHGFLFGDSIYEVVRFYGQKAFGWDEHLQRLKKSAKRLAIPIEKVLSKIKPRAKALLKELNQTNPVLRIIVTRGEGRLHIDPRSVEEPQLFMAAWPFGASLVSEPLQLKVSSLDRNLKTATDPAIKSGNYLNNVLAYQEAVRTGFDDALFLNVHGEVAELTTSNVGWIRGQTVYTPHEDVGILHGITRRFLLDWEKVEKVRHKEEALRSADTVFALSTLKEVLPIKKIHFRDGKTVEYGSTESSRLKALQNRFIENRERICEDLPDFFEI